MPGLFIVIPVYNEEDCIEAVVRQWHPVVEEQDDRSRLLVLDDGSRDTTPVILRRLKSNLPRMIVLEKENSGHGPTCLTGYRHALDAGAHWVFQTDSDGQTRPEDFQAFWDSREDADFILGLRHHRGDGLARSFITRFLEFVILFVFQVRIKDPNVPFRLMRADLLKKYLDMIPPDFFLANALLSVLVKKNGESIKRIPITFGRRRGGSPSISLSQFAGVGWRVSKSFIKYRMQG